MSFEGELADSNPEVVARALVAFVASPSETSNAIEAIEARLDDARRYDQHASYGPTYKLIAELAIDALVAAGPAALPALERAIERAFEASVPEPCYDQGAYIGDYSSRTFVLADAAMDAIRRIGGKHDGSVAWIGMSPSRWRTETSVEIMVRAIFEKSGLADYVRRFVVASAREAHAFEDAELADAAAVAERIAYELVPADVVTAARAAATHSRASGARVVARALALNFDRKDALLALADLGSAARADRLRDLVPLDVSWPKPEPPAKARRTTWDALYDAVIERPDDDEARHAFASWLSERGDPRGEFIDVQLRIAAAKTRDAALEARAEELQRGQRWTRFSSVGFARGFVESLYVGSAMDTPPVSVLRGEPTLREILIGGKVELRYLVEDPEARRIRKLVLRGGYYYDFDVKPLFESTMLTGLRHLGFVGCNFTPSWSEPLVASVAFRAIDTLDVSSNGSKADALEKLRAAKPGLKVIV